MPDLLYEIGTEELPAGYVGPALATEAGARVGAMAAREALA